MICTFCGTENPQGNRFCGICGVRLERRKSERRINPWESSVCPDCGHVNEPQYKFCGMCGAQVDRRIRERRASSDGARATAKANVGLPAPEARRAMPYHAQEADRVGSATLVALSSMEQGRSRSGMLHGQTNDVSSSLSGPSFLGLNEQTDAEYLLEDERSSHRGLRAFLLLIVLAAIVGLIFVQYRSSLKANPRSPERPNPGPANVPRPEGRSRAPDKDKGLQTAFAVRRLESAVSTLAIAANDSLLANVDLIAKKQKSDEQDPAVNASREVSTDDSPATGEKTSPSLVKAQQYLHGRGVRQNCEQGLIYLRAAARENNPQAAVQMGALYSSGLCVSRDRVKAYEWFVSAREQQPQNRWITKNLNELWAQMTPQERHQIHQ